MRVRVDLLEPFVQYFSHTCHASSDTPPIWEDSHERVVYAWLIASNNDAPTAPIQRVLGPEASSPLPTDTQTVEHRSDPIDHRLHSSLSHVPGPSDQLLRQAARMGK